MVGTVLIRLSTKVYNILEFVSPPRFWREDYQGPMTFEYG